VDDPAGRLRVVPLLYLIYDRADDRSTAAIVSEDKGMIAAGATFAIVAFLLLYVFN